MPRRLTDYFNRTSNRNFERQETTALDEWMRNALQPMERRDRDIHSEWNGSDWDTIDNWNRELENYTRVEPDTMLPLIRRAMPNVIRSELVHEEPMEPPSEEIAWHSYRSTYSVSPEYIWLDVKLPLKSKHKRVCKI